MPRTLMLSVAAASALVALAGCGSSSTPSSGAAPKASSCPSFVQADNECDDYNAVDWTRTANKALKPQLVKALDITGKQKQLPTSRFCQSWNGTHTFYENKFEAGDDSAEHVLGMIAFVQGAYGC